jgi:hypothetical protein
MQRLANVIRMTVPDKRATNPSKSSYGFARMGLGASALSGGGAGYWLTGDPNYIALAAAPLIKGSANLSKGVAATRAAPSTLARRIGNVSRVGVAGGAGYAGGR